MASLLIEKNDEGKLLIDVHKAAREAAINVSDSSWRYNGGWVKSVTSLDKTKTDGYSLIGEFIEKGPQWVAPGFFLDCNIHGSRKHPERTFTLFEVSPAGEIRTIQRVEDTKGWAVSLWPAIADFLKPKDRTAILQARKTALLVELEEIERELEVI